MILDAFGIACMITVMWCLYLPGILEGLAHQRVASPLENHDEQTSASRRYCSNVRIRIQLKARLLECSTTAKYNPQAKVHFSHVTQQYLLFTCNTRAAGRFAYPGYLEIQNLRVFRTEADFRILLYEKNEIYSSK